MANIKQSKMLGLITELLNENNSHRPIKPEEDIYPPPMMTMQPSRKVEGLERVTYVMMYQQVARFRELLLEYCRNNEQEQIFNHQDYYKQHFIHIICSGNMRANIMYCDNRETYHQIFFYFLEIMKSHDLVEYLNRRPMAIWDKPHSLTKDLGKISDYQRHRNIFMIHYIPVLLNYGYKPNEEEIEEIDYQPLKDFLKSDLAKKVMESENPPG